MTTWEALGRETLVCGFEKVTEVLDAVAVVVVGFCEDAANTCRSRDTLCRHCCWQLNFDARYRVVSMFAWYLGGATRGRRSLRPLFLFFSFSFSRSCSFFFFLTFIDGSHHHHHGGCQLVISWSPFCCQ